MIILHHNENQVIHAICSSYKHNGERREIIRRTYGLVFWFRFAILLRQIGLMCEDVKCRKYCQKIFSVPFVAGRGAQVGLVRC